MIKRLVYLAVPYSHADPKVVQDRVSKVNQVAARLMREGIIVFSPISYCHPLAIAENLPTDWKYWQEYLEAYMHCCHKLIVLKLDGWETSVGVSAEIKIARELELEIEYMENFIFGE